MKAINLTSLRLGIEQTLLLDQKGSPLDGTIPPSTVPLLNHSLTLIRLVQAGATVENDVLQVRK